MAKRRVRRGRIPLAAPLLAASTTAALLAAAATQAPAFPVHGKQTVLPVGTELNEDSLVTAARNLQIGGDRRRQILSGQFRRSGVQLAARSWAGWRGRPASAAALAMSMAPPIPSFTFPDLSTRPGTFDTTGGLFNGKADNHALDPVTIPSLRGARYLAPYGHDGRIASLRDFVRNVIVNEFAGPEPSPALLDAIVVYIEDIDFLPNPQSRSGRAADGAGERRRTARRSAVCQAVPARSRRSAAPAAMCPRPPLSIIGSTMSAPAGCLRRRPC